MTNSSPAYRDGTNVTLRRLARDLTHAHTTAQALLGKDEHLVPLTARRYAVVNGRRGAILRRALDGASFRSIGEDFDISGERVRQITQPYLDKPHAAAIRHEATLSRWRPEAEKRARAYASENPNASVAEIVREAGRRLGRDGVIAAIGKPDALRRPLRATIDRNVQFTDEDCYAALRAAAGDEETPVSMGTYAEATPSGPTPFRLIQRFGSWRAACEAAGVRCASTGRTSWYQAWSNADLTRWAYTFFAAHGPTATTAQYEKWSRTKPKAPSLITLRNRLGRWSVIRQEWINERSAV